MSDPIPPVLPAGVSRVLGGPGVKLGLIAVLLLLMQIPTLWVGSLIDERQQRQAEVQFEIGRSWGPPQSLLGPIMVVPFRATEPQPRLPTGQAQPNLPVRGFVHIVPSRLAATVALSPERRKRGLFGAVVYGAAVELAGGFVMPGTINTPYADAELLWREAFVTIGAKDVRAMDADTRLNWDNRALTPVDDPPSGNGCNGLGFLAWAVPMDGAPAAGQAFPFATSFALRGTGSFHLVPAARQVEMAMTAPWPTPSFNGAVLPARSDVGADAFRAEWRDGGGARQAVWTSRDAMQCSAAAYAVQSTDQQMGVDLLEAVPTYRMVNRAAKYAVLFLALAFLTYFLFETMTGHRIHLVEYGLLGLSITMFALLLLSLAEPLGFAPAYAGATAAVMLQASLYTAAVTRRAKLAGVFAAVLAALFGFLYVVLNLESYSLLVGAVALFAVLSVVMAVTGRLDWSGRTAAR